MFFGKATAQSEHIVDFNIRAGALAFALTELGKQANLEIAFSPVSVSEIDAPTVVGRMTPAEALELLLAGSGLHSRRSRHGVILVVKGDAPDAEHNREANVLIENRKKGLLAGVSSLAAAFGANAQDRAAENGANNNNDVIIVTAQKRAQNQQDVPIAIQSFSAADLADRGLTNIAEVGVFTPNVTIDSTSAFSGSTQVLGAFIRGIGQSDFAFNLEPGVGVYIDGVYYARALGSVVDLLDLERVEVLKGPQGTLFGRNTIGGALNITTRQPGESFAFTGEVTAGRFDPTDIRGAVDVPLIEGKLLSQIAFSSKNRDGYHRRLPFPGTFVTDTGRFVGSGEEEFNARQGDANTDTIRAKLKWLASDSVDVLFSADFSDTDEQAAPNTLIGTFPNAPDPADGLLGFFHNVCISAPPGAVAPFCDAQRSVVGGALAGVNLDGTNTNDRLVYGNQFITGSEDTSFGAGANFSKVEAKGASITVDWAVNDNINFKSITAYRSIDTYFGTDVDGAPQVINDTSFQMDQTQVSQEFQLSGLSLDGDLSWLVGLYYFQEDGLLVDYPIFGGGLVQIFGPNDLDNEAYAVFGHVNYALTERFSITAGLRFTREEKEFEGRQQDLNAFASFLGLPPEAFPDPTNPTLYFPAGTNRRTFNNLSPKLGVEYRLTDDILTYLSYSEGFKSGGWTTRATLPILAAPEFDEEIATTYELGWKSELAGRRLRLNAAVFFTDYEDLQITVQRGLSPFFENAAQSEIRGVEVDFAWLATENLTISGALGYLDAEYTELEAGAVLQENFEFNNTPEYTYTLTVDYDLPTNTEGTWSIRADYAYRDEQANDAENTPELFADSVGLVNAALTYASASRAWEVVLGGTNLTDERYLVSGFRQPGAGVIDGNYSRPREWYLTFRFFGGE
ncbi:MAG: TonB-dependent receptor [Pseudomonadota bacterium]